LRIESYSRSAVKLVGGLTAVALVRDVVRHEAVGERGRGALGVDAGALQRDRGRAAENVPDDAAVIERERWYRTIEDRAVPDTATFCGAAFPVRHSLVAEHDHVVEDKIGIVGHPGSLGRGSPVGSICR